jgi:hypothetical protein
MTRPSPTLASLVALGFERRPASYGRETVGYRFPVLDLTASFGMGRDFFEAVHLRGVFNSGRTLAEIDYQMPPDLEEPGVAAAWVSYALRDLRKELEPVPDWMVEGDRNQDALPWNREREAFEKRLWCEIDRDYARLFRRNLKKALAALPKNADMYLTFDGRVLVADLDGKTHGVVAEGPAWPARLLMRAGPDTVLPPRFSSDRIEVSYYDGSLYFDRYRYPASEAPE